MKPLYLPAISVFLLLTFNSLKAQVVIKGIVKESKTNSSLPFVRVTLINPTDSTQHYSSLSDSIGRYEIKDISKGKYFMNAFLIGYEKLVDSLTIIDAPPSLIFKDIYLTLEKVIKLNEVTITSKRPLVEYKDGKILLNVENNSLSTGTNIWDLLSKSPGIETTDSGISLFGSSGAQVLLDGRNILLQGSDLANVLRGMSSNQVAQLEIIKNPAAKYDLGRGTGIINIKLKKNVSDGMNGTLGLTTGHGMYYKYNTLLNLNFKKNKTSFFITLGHQKNKDYRREPAYIHFWDRRSPVLFNQNRFSLITKNLTSINGGLNYDLTKNSTVGIQFNSQFNKSYSEYTNESIISESKVDSLINTKSQIKQPHELQLYNIYYKTLIGKNINLGVNADYGEYASNNSQYYQFNYLARKDTKYNRDDYFNNYSPSKITILSFALDMSKSFKGNAVMEAGYKSSFISNRADITYQKQEDKEWHTTLYDNYNYKEKVNAAYISFQKKFDRLALSGGMRVEHTTIAAYSLTKKDFVNSIYFKWFPSFEIDYSATEKHTFNFSLSTSFERPSYHYLSPLTIMRDPNSSASGNIFLIPSYTKNVELVYSLLNKYRIGLQFQDITNRIEQSVVQDYSTLILQNIIVNIQKCFYYRLYYIIPVKVTPWWESNMVINGYYIQYKTNYLSGVYNKIKPVVYVSATNTFIFSKVFSGDLLLYYRTPSLNGLYEVGSRFYVDLAIKRKLSDFLSVSFIISDLFHSNKWIWDINYLNQHSGYQTINDSRTFKLNINYQFGNSLVKKFKKNDTKISNERERFF